MAPPPRRNFAKLLLAAATALAIHLGPGGRGPPAVPAQAQETPPAAGKHANLVHKCTRQSIMLARQMLAHELQRINQLGGQVMLADLDDEELQEGQKHSLSSILVSGAGALLLNPNGQPLLEVESSYFRQPAGGGGHGAPTLRLLRRHQDRCYLNPDRRQFTLIVGLSLGPVEHHLDVVYNLPWELRLGQPLDWRYGQIVVQVARMHYEIGLKQAADYNKLASWQWRPAGQQDQCPLEVADVTYLPTPGNSLGQARTQVSIQTSGLASNNQTRAQVERLFDDFTRPAVSQRLRQLLSLHLNTRTLPLAAASP